MRPQNLDTNIITLFASSLNLLPQQLKLHGRAELSADYCVSNTATRVRLRLQAAYFDTYAGSWRLEERELTSQPPSSLRCY